MDETVIDYNEMGIRTCIEIKVGDGEDVAEVHAEDADGVVALVLDEDDIDALVDALLRAKDALRANR